MDDFIALILSDRTYVNLLFYGLIMTLLIIANILEQRDDPAPDESADRVRHG